MALFVNPRLQKNVLMILIQQKTRVFSSIRQSTVLDINATKLKTQHNIFVKNLIQQRLYVTNSSFPHEPVDNSSLGDLGDKHESASLLSKHKSDDLTSSPEFTSTDLMDSQTEQITSQVQTDNKHEPDWSKSFFGLSTKAFPQETIDILLAPIVLDDIECKPDGLIYLPEIKYRRILNKSFGPGGWGLAPRGVNSISPKIISREYALVCHGRLVSVSRGEQEYFDPSGLATAAEGAKSNALMRCCKDLGIASELWDPIFVREFKKEYCEQVFVEHVVNKKRRKIWVKKGSEVDYPFVKV